MVRFHGSPLTKEVTMSGQQSIHKLEVYSAREALVAIKAKLSIAMLSRSDATITAKEAIMLLTLIDEKTPWSL